MLKALLRQSVQGILETQPDTVRPAGQCLQESKKYERLVYEKNNFAESLAGLPFCVSTSSSFPNFGHDFKNYPGRLRAARQTGV